MTRLFAGTPFDIPPRCDRCGELESDCTCPDQQSAPPAKDRLPVEKQVAKVRTDRRKHKRMVTVVWGLDPSDSDLKELLSSLQSACGAGGSVQDDQIELQGDHADRVRKELKRIGYRLSS